VRFKRIEAVCRVIAVLLIVVFAASDIQAQYDQDRMILSVQEYFTLLSAADSLKFRQNFEIPVSLIFNEDESKTYYGLSTLESRKNFIREFWRLNNPNPLAGGNLWLNEFLDRYNFVRKNFAMGVEPYFDDRGRYYMKFGKPYFRHVDSGGLKRTRFFNNEEIYSTVRQLYDFNPPMKDFMTKPNESWSYWDEDHQFVIHFIKEGVFKEETSLDKALHTRQERNRIWYWMDLMKDRANLTPLTDETVRKIEQFEIEIIRITNTGIINPDIGNALRPHRMVLEEKSFSEAREKAFKHFLSPYTSPRVRNANRLPFSADVTFFRAGEDSTRADITFYPAIEEIIKRRPEPEDVTMLAVEFASIIRDKDRYPGGTVRTNHRYPVELMNNLQFGNAVDMHSLYGTPQKSELTLQVQDMSTGRIGFLQEEIDVRDFRGDTLMVSDINFYTPVTADEQKRVMPVSTMEATEVMPYPFTSIHKDFQPVIYFEIYNLERAGIRETCNIEVKAFKEKSGENIVKRIGKWIIRAKDYSMSFSYKRAVSGNESREFLSLDMSRLTAGEYTLVITVTDPDNTRIKAKSEKDFSIF